MFASLSRFKFSQRRASLVRVGVLRASLVCALLASLLGVLPLASLVRVSVLRASLVRVTVGVLRASLVGPGVLRRRASLDTVCRCWPQLDIR